MPSQFLYQRNWVQGISVSILFCPALRKQKVQLRRGELPAVSMRKYLLPTHRWVVGVNPMILPGQPCFWLPMMQPGSRANGSPFQAVCMVFKLWLPYVPFKQLVWSRYVLSAGYSRRGNGT